MTTLAAGADTGELSPGVGPLDHTADVGIEVRAPTLPELFRRAVAGMLVLLNGAEAEDRGEVRGAKAAWRCAWWRYRRP